MTKTHLIIPLATLALATSALASGNSPMRPPRPPREAAPETDTLDNSRYALGKAVFTGKARWVANPSAAKQQKARLNQLASRTGKEGASLPALAGRLSDDQMDALEYYTAKRFGAH